MERAAAWIEGGRRSLARCNQAKAERAYAVKPCVAKYIVCNGALEAFDAKITRNERMGWKSVLQSYLTAAASVSQTMRLPYPFAWWTLLSTRLRHGIGPFYFCLFSLDGKPAKDWPEYLTNYEFEPVQRRWNPKEAHALVRDKTRFHARCEAAGLPVPTAIAVIGHSSDPSAPTVTESRTLSTILIESGTTEFFFKHAGGAHGHGAFVVKRSGESYRFAGRAGDAEALLQYALSSLPEGERYLVQPRLRSHPDLAPIMSPSGLGTVRIVTRLLSGDAIVVAACLRITVGENVTDNFSVGSAGNLTAPLDPYSGSIGPAVGSARKEWPEMHTVLRHPDTGAAFEGRTVPLWERVKDLALTAHKAFPELGAIGWDIAVTPDGPILIEANHAWDINLLQVAHRRGLRSQMTDVMGPI